MKACLSSSSYPYRLFAPGPVPLSPAVKKILCEPMIHHRSEEFKKILSESLSLLQHVFQTTQPVMILTSAGSGAMEAAIVNTLSPKDEVLFIVSGKFGERWWKMGKTFGLQCQQLNIEWGKAATPEQLADTLKKYPSIKAVFCQACETSTGVLHPIKELALTVRQHSPSSLFVVDAMTALGATHLAMDDWDIDVLVAGSQKAFMLPAGLSFISLSVRAWQAYEKSLLPRFYFDLGPEQKSNNNHETRFSSSVSLVRALHCSLNEMFIGEKLEQSISRCQRLAKATRRVFKHYGWEIFSRSPSPSVTAACVPQQLAGKKITSHLLNQYNIYIAGGQDHLKEKIVRVGHLGHISDEDQIFFAQALGETLKEYQWPYATEEHISQAILLTKESLNFSHEKGRPSQ